MDGLLRTWLDANAPALVLALASASRPSAPRSRTHGRAPAHASPVPVTSMAAHASRAPLRVVAPGVLSRDARRRGAHHHPPTRTITPTRTVTLPRAVAEASTPSPSLADSLRPSSADCAKTLVHIADVATISTTCEDGVALGTHASFIVSKSSGDVILRMRSDAMHTRNVERDPRCSLYVMPESQPPGVLSRATLIGALTRCDEETASKASAQYDALHGAGVGVDAAGADDVYYVLDVDKVFYVGGLGSDARAELIDGDAYAKAAPDPLADCAKEVVDAMNGDRYQDILNFADASLPPEATARGAVAAEARMLWVDTLGFDVRVVTGGNGKSEVLDVRLPFPAPANTQQEALSALTMLAQSMWEEEANYQPVPVPVERPEGDDEGEK